MGSLAKLGPRVGALIIDWIPVTILSIAFFDYNGAAQLALFALINIVFIPTLGGTPGHRLVGMRFLRADGAWTGLWRPVVRTIALCLVIPAVIWDQNQRGLHDKLAGTILVKAPTLFSSES